MLKDRPAGSVCFHGVLPMSPSKGTKVPLHSKGILGCL
jgi:hypothetical protein